MKTLPLDFQPLVEAAKPIAVDRFNRLRASGKPRGMWQWDWEDNPPGDRAILVEAVTAELADLSLPSTWDSWVRWLASRMGYPDHLIAEAGAMFWVDMRVWFVGWPYIRRTECPSAAGITDPAEALCAAVLAAGGGR